MFRVHEISEIRGKFFEEFHEGETYLTSRRTLREADLIDFCNLCWFNLSMFFDEIYAEKEMPYKTPVFPGPFIIPLAIGLFLKLGVYERTVIALLGIKNLRFKTSLRVGDTMEVEVTILTKKDSRTYSDRGILSSLFTIKKVHHDLSKEFIMSFEMTHLLKKRDFKI
jgi:oxepin-CoA hydrolase/3-oxo-5,6-dehydrosuberyl-CoA semialdehyde dehydrogenase